MKARQLRWEVHHLPLRSPFRIARGVRTEISVVRVYVQQEDTMGSAECFPHERYGESVSSACASLSRVAKDIDEGAGRKALQGLLPPGAARNALDGALWSLDARLAKKRPWNLTEFGGAWPTPDICRTALTVTIDSPEAMARVARTLPSDACLKVKLQGDREDAERIQALRQAASRATVIVDANEGWDRDHYIRMLPVLEKCDVQLLEQPFPAREDSMLAELPRPVPVCADESFHTSGDFKNVAERYDVVNIKLDKTGGLTEALAVARLCPQYNLRYMVGCMLGSSLAMAPASMLWSGACFVDLDGPFHLKQDIAYGILQDVSTLQVPSTFLWG